MSQSAGVSAATASKMPLALGWNTASSSKISTEGQPAAFACWMIARWLKMQPTWPALERHAVAQRNFSGAAQHARDRLKPLEHDPGFARAPGEGGEALPFLSQIYAKSRTEERIDGHL